MTSVREDLGFNAEPRKRPARRFAVVETCTARETGDALFGPWGVEVLRPDGKRDEVYGATREAAIEKAHAHAKGLNR